MTAVRTEALKTVEAEPIRLSDAGASRAFDRLRPEAATLLMGMVRETSRTNGTQAVIDQAAASMAMTRTAALRGLRELRQSGLLRQREDGVLILHRLFSSYGHELARRKQACTGSVGHVVPLRRELA